jgi:hypothetical protein
MESRFQPLGSASEPKWSHNSIGRWRFPICCPLTLLAYLLPFRSFPGFCIVGANRILTSAATGRLRPEMTSCILSSSAISTQRYVKIIYPSPAIQRLLKIFNFVVNYHIARKIWKVSGKWSPKWERFAVRPQRDILGSKHVVSAVIRVSTTSGTVRERIREKIIKQEKTINRFIVIRTWYFSPAWGHPCERKRDCGEHRPLGSAPERSEACQFWSETVRGFPFGEGQSSSFDKVIETGPNNIALRYLAAVRFPNRRLDG